MVEEENTQEQESQPVRHSSQQSHKDPLRMKRIIKLTLIVLILLLFIRHNRMICSKHSDSTKNLAEDLERSKTDSTTGAVAEGDDGSVDGGRDNPGLEVKRF